MPIHLPPINRRRFLAGSLAAGAGLLLPRPLLADQPVDPNCFMLLADPHIPPGRDQVCRGIKPGRALEQVGREILARDVRPAGAIIAGDCACLQGTPGDYAMLRTLLAPLRQAGMPIHLALGNHDQREHFLAAFPDAKPSPADGLPPNKLVSVLETPHANWFLLDSLEKTNVSLGLLGKAQLAWLSKALDARPNKPALILAHHNPEPLLNIHGLTDTAALFEVLAPRKQVKAFFFGHTHQWSLGRIGGIHLVNLPPVAWLFDPASPRGFVAADLHREGVTLVLHAIDDRHPKHGEKIELNWRA
jgi:3',5'-cyclic AMP phosphodiesterase CpdA